MAFNSISSSSIPAASNAKYFAKKKQGNNSAKSEQCCKLDVRHQQWLSKVKSKGCEEKLSGGEMHAHNGMDQGPRGLEVSPTNGDQKDGSMHKGKDSDSSSKSDSSHTGSAVEGICSGTHFSGSMSCSGGTSYSRNVSEVDNEGGLDNWEAVADALLAATDDNHEQCDQKFESLAENENVVQLDHPAEVVKQSISTVDILKPEPEKRDNTFKSSVEDENVAQLNHRPEVVNQPTGTEVLKTKPEDGQAWRRGDAFHSKPKPEFGQAWWQFRSKPKPEFGQPRRCSDAFRSKPGFGQEWKPKPGFSQEWKPKPKKHDQKCNSLVENINVTQSDNLSEVVKQPAPTVDYLKPKIENGLAWRCDDASRPKSHPNAQKKHSFPIKGYRHYRHGGATSGCKNFVSAPTSCPICTEDLDSTDSSFLPCSCGFQLCLFCHKKILEEDGRCPGCRKHYDNNSVHWEQNSDMIGDCATL